MSKKPVPQFVEWNAFRKRLAGRGYHLSGAPSVVDPVTGKRTGGTFSQRWTNMSQEEAVSKGYLPDQYRNLIKVSPAQRARLQNYGPAPVKPQRARAAPQRVAFKEDDTYSQDAGYPVQDLFSPQVLATQQQGQRRGMRPVQIAKPQVQDLYDLYSPRPQGQGGQGGGGGMRPQASVRAQLSAQSALQAARGYAITDLPECCSSKYDASFEGRPSYPCRGDSCPPGTIGPIKPDGSVYMVIVAKNGVTKWQKYGSRESALKAKQTFGY